MLTPVDYYYLVKELGELVGYKLKEVYLAENDFVFEFKLKDKVKYFVVGKYYCYLTENKPAEEKREGFANFLLRKLKNRKVHKVEEEGFNKILVFKFGKFKLIFEFIGKGNIILCEDGKIVGALREREFRDRKILKGEEYITPKGESFSEEIKDKEKLLKLHIGEIYANEIVERNLSLGEFLKQKATPVVYFKEGEKFLISAFELKTLKLEKERKESLSKAIEEFYRKKDKEEIIREKQKETLEKYVKEEGELRKMVRLLLENRREIEEALDYFKKNKKLIAPIKKISGKKVFLEIEGKKLNIEFGKDLKREINRLYEKSKKIKEKIKKIKELIAKEVKSKSKEKKVEAKKEWYEKFRYFFTSRGLLVIAGKDAKTNEQIIKKYCKKNDIVLHAHIPGSPFGVIRGEGKEIREQDIREAGEFIACYSKFWTSKLGIGDVYWVKAKQVSKKVPGHQAIKKGSFMIYGKRNFLRVALRFCIGVDENFKVVKGPESSVKKYARYYVTLIPGEKKGKELGKEIKEKLIAKAKKEDKEKIEKINLDEFLRVVPYGKGEVIQQ